jgi:putative ABC transport system substrate-binding protein
MSSLRENLPSALPGSPAAQSSAKNYRRRKLMRKNVIRLALCAMLFALSYSASAQQPKKVPRIGYLTSSERARDAARSEAIQLALQNLGHIEGQNIITEYRSAEGNLDRLPALAAELVGLKVDIIVIAGGDDLIRVAKNATKTIPIVMTGQGSDPVEGGFVASLARPGGNVSGLTNLLVQLGDKRLELLKEAGPKLARVAVLYIPGNRTHGLELKEILNRGNWAGGDRATLAVTRPGRFR